MTGSIDPSAAAFTTFDGTRSMKNCTSGSDVVVAAVEADGVGPRSATAAS
jgi:hypothetical protein